MGGKRDYENLLLAAVVRDIGKFWQGMGESGKQPSIGMSGNNNPLKIVLCSIGFLEQNKNDI